MKKFLRHCRLSENLIAHGNYKTPRRNLLYFFSALLFLFSFSFANAQFNFLSANNSSNHIVGNFDQPKNSFYSHTDYFGEKDDYTSNHFATITSVASGNWSDGTIWSGGIAPTSGDDVTIGAGTIVTVDVAAASGKLTIIGRLDINNNINLDVNGDFTNNGTFNAGTGTASVSFKGAGINTISGSSNSAFNDIIVNKGIDISSVLEATGAVSNTGNISIINGLFKITSGTFQFSGIAGPTIPATGGLWVNGAILNSGNFSSTFNGLLRVTAGVANFGTSSGNSLEINNGGGTLFAFLDVQGGTINVAGRLFINNRGTLMMSGGAINVNTVGLNNTTNAGFEVTATSHINPLSGGTIILQNPNSGTGGDLLITSGTGTKTIAGGTFQIGNASTPAGSVFNLSSAIPLYNLTIFDNNAAGSLTTNDLTIFNQLTLNGPLSLNGQNLVMGETAPALGGTIGANNGMIITNGTGEARKIFSSGVVVERLVPLKTEPSVDINYFQNLIFR